jgi:hypothetical protein
MVDKLARTQYSSDTLFAKDEPMPGSSQASTISVDLLRLDAECQARLDVLLDKNNAGCLTPEEHQELEHLVAQYEHILLQNAEALLRAARPDLVDASGRINRARLAKAARRTAHFLRTAHGT